MGRNGRFFIISRFSVWIENVTYLKIARIFILSKKRNFPSFDRKGKIVHFYAEMGNFPFFRKTNSRSQPSIHTSLTSTSCSEAHQLSVKFVLISPRFIEWTKMKSTFFWLTSFSKHLDSLVVLVPQQHTLFCYRIITLRSMAFSFECETTEILGYNQCNRHNRAYKLETVSVAAYQLIEWPKHQRMPSTIAHLWWTELRRTKKTYKRTVLIQTITIVYSVYITEELSLRNVVSWYNSMPFN